MRYLSCCVLVMGLAASIQAQIPEAEKDEILRGTNEFRVAQKKKPLTVSYHLSQVAQAHCDDMARVDKYGDDDKNGHVLFGKGFSDRAKAAKFGYFYMAENVGKSTAPGAGIGRLATKGWINSPGHRKNMLNDQGTVIGVGLAQSKSGTWYFAQLFAKPKVSSDGEGDDNSPPIQLTIFNNTKEPLTITFKSVNNKFSIRPKSGFSLRFAGAKTLNITVHDSNEKVVGTFEAAVGEVFNITRSESGKFQIKKSE